MKRDIFITKSNPMKTTATLLLFLVMQFFAAAQTLSVRSLTLEHLKNPVGVDEQSPRFSWILESPVRATVQTAYSINVATDPSFSSKTIVWQSGKISSDKSVLVSYEGTNLKPATKYFWRVKVWDNHKSESKWSETAWFITGLQKAEDWKASWIELPGDTLRYAPSPLFRKEFESQKPVKQALAFVTSHGFYEIHINGMKAGDQVLTPGWTSYGKRLQYQVYDVTGMIASGKNAIGAMLGDGWYRCTLGWGNNWAVYGKKLGLLFQLRITYTDGTEKLISSDETWKGNNNGPVRMNDIYNGETYDATFDITGWDKPGYNDSNWKKVDIGKYQNSNIIASESVPVRKTEEIKPVRIFRTPKGSLVADMGQNMVGWIRLKVKGEKGKTVILRHAEVLDKYGEFYTDNLRSAKCQLTYTLSGKGYEIYEPSFTFMGFRYVEITGFPGELTKDNLTGVVIHSDMAKTGQYTSSSPLINQLQSNILWGMRGNYVDVPTDCPQRDERLGWTGDAQAFCRTAAFNMDVASFFSKWMKDISADQRKGGEVPFVIPDILNKQGSETAPTSAGWGDVAVIAPWTMYTVYGDRKMLETQYPGMKAWVDYIRNKSGDSYIWKGGSVFGDWLFYHPPVNNHTEPDGYTQHDFIATAFFAYSTGLLADAAEALGKKEDAAFYRNELARIKEVFAKEYITPAGRVGTCSQTSYVLALMFDLIPAGLREKSVSFLVDDIKSRRNHLSTGFLGTPYLCFVLSKYGYSNIAYDLLMQESYPSWLYPVKMGATTIWERWDGQKTDSTFQDVGMNSFNHYAYGSIGDWMYRVSAGIETDGPGYKKIIIKPTPGKRLTSSKAVFESPYGTIISGWEKKNDLLVVTVRIPSNAAATVILPADDPSKVTIAGKPLGGTTGLGEVSRSAGSVTFTAGSGDYTFEIKQ